MQFHYSKTIGNMTTNRAKDVLANTNRMIFDYEELITTNGSVVSQTWEARIYKGKDKKKRDRTATAPAYIMTDDNGKYDVIIKQELFGTYETVEYAAGVIECEIPQIISF